MIDFYQVWHTDEHQGKIAPSAKYLNLANFEFPKPSNIGDIQEYRVYQIPNEYFESPNPYIGFASTRWSDKFPKSPTIEYLLTSFKVSGMRGRLLHSYITAQPHWIEHMNHFHRGMLQYVLEGAAQIGLSANALNNPALPMCNSFICSKDVFFEMKEKFNHIYNYFENTYQHDLKFADNGYGDRVLGCFYERILMICAASCDNVMFYQPMMYWNW